MRQAAKQAIRAPNLPSTEMIVQIPQRKKHKTQRQPIPYTTTNAGSEKHITANRMATDTCWCYDSKCWTCISNPARVSASKSTGTGASCKAYESRLTLLLCFKGTVTGETALIAFWMLTDHVPRLLQVQPCVPYRNTGLTASTASAALDACKSCLRVTCAPGRQTAQLPV